jgi:leucyl/phenylalanyl-tRNA--protein transferase
MGMSDGSIHWFSPDPRAILPLDGFKIQHGLRRTLQKKKFEIRVDTAFAEVIRACAEREDTWITDEIVASYEHLHDLGCAHSVEAWHEKKLAGGLYGVVLGGAFFGESMFHRVTDASKVALVGLVERMKARRFVLLDTQWTTPHLEQFGATEISRRSYLRLLARAVELKRSFI